MVELIVAVVAAAALGCLAVVLTRLGVAAAAVLETPETADTDDDAVVVRPRVELAVASDSDVTDAMPMLDVLPTKIEYNADGCGLSLLLVVDEICCGCC